MSQQISPLLQARINNQKLGLVQDSFQPKVDLTQKPDTFEISNNENNEEKKKTNTGKIIAIGLAVAAAVAGVIYFIKKGKAPKNLKLEEMTSEKFKQLKADKFTGKVQGQLKNGDNVVMEYVDGILNKSTRSGKVNVERIYENINNEHIVKKTVDGVTKETNITKLQQSVKDAQEKLKNLLKDNSKLSVEEFEKQSGEIQYKSKAQKNEVDKIVADKKEIIKKEEAEKLAKAKAEAEAKAKAEAEAKAKFEAEVAQEVKEGKLDIRTLEEKEADKEIKRMQDAQDEAVKAFQAPRKSALESYRVFEESGAIDKAAMDEYQQRLQQGKSLTQRVRTAKGTSWGSPDSLEISKPRIKQLKSLSKEQLAALDDKTIDDLVHNRYSMSAMQNFDYLKGLTPEQIIKLQNSPHGRHYLSTYLNGNYTTQKAVTDVLEAMKKIMGE